MDNLMPMTTTATELQRNFKNISKKAKKLKKPLIVLSNNQPEGVYIDYNTFKNTYYKKTSKKGKSDFSQFLGLWTPKEAEEFNKRIDDMFERIDPEMWQ